MNVWVEPVTLENEWVRLEPLRLEHADALWQVCPPDTFQYYVTLQPRSRSIESFREYLTVRSQIPNVVSFVVFDQQSGEVVGETSYMEIRPEARGLEIGMTWYADAAKGTNINPACKLILLSHAFEQLGAIRVQLKTDGRNLHSQAAIRKLGAVYEGTLRSHGIQPNGFVRDTVMYSILADEWMAVRDRLEQRLRMNS